MDDEDGCPDGAQTVVITKTEIKILEQVFFDTGKATIKPASYPLLNTVATALRQNPQITGLLVEGHTDDVGNDAKNMELSKARAASVKDYLINEGKIDASRLSSEGFGEEKPLCPRVPELLKAKAKKDEVDACRAENRRVQFKIIAVDGKPVSASESVTIEQETIIEQ